MTLPAKPRILPRAPSVDPANWHFNFEPSGSCPKPDVDHQRDIAATLADGQRHRRIGRSDQ